MRIVVRSGKVVTFLALRRLSDYFVYDNARKEGVVFIACFSDLVAKSLKRMSILGEFRMVAYYLQLFFQYQSICNHTRVYTCYR